MADTTGQADLRAENVERVVKGFALQEYTMKQLVMTQPSHSWSESYYQETATELSGGLGSAIKGIPRLAAFPYGEASWTKKTSYNEKYGMEGVISWEDAMTNNIDVIARTLLRISRAVAKAVDTQIWDVLTENRSVVNINSVTIASGYEWNSATIANRDPVQDVLNACREIAIDNYSANTGNGFMVVSPTDFANLIGNSAVRNAGSFYTDSVTRNGNVGRFVGLKVIVSNVVTADYALVGVAKECATWKEVVPLTVHTIEDPGKCYTIRAYEIGTCQLTNPQALCLVINTQA